MKKSIALLLALLMIFALSACGGESASTDPNAGLYNAVKAEAYGIEVGLDSVYPDGFSVELKDKGKCSIAVGEKKASGKWTLDGSTISVSGGGVDLTGTLYEGYIIFDNVMDTGMNMTFAKEGVNISVQGIESWDETDTWTGDWYGWSVITDATGDYADLVGAYGDCMARITATSGSVDMIVWDEDLPLDNAVAEMSLALVTPAYAQSSSGYFMDNQLGNGDIDFTLNNYGLEQLLVFTGTTGTSDDSMTVTFFLRPWGADWSELNNAIDTPYEINDMYPSEYEWYTSAVAQGRAMPDMIGG